MITIVAIFRVVLSAWRQRHEIRKEMEGGVARSLEVIRMLEDKQANEPEPQKSSDNRR